MKCWVNINQNKKVNQFFTDSFDALAAEIESATHVTGLDIYHACAVFKDASSRRTQNALAAKAFWMDIDCGEGKPYADADAGIQAVDEFANRLDLPLPLIVHSGRGVHAYWPLAESIPAAQWGQTAKLLKRAAEVHGLHADPSRTADISSILRPVGTINHKHGQAQPVYAKDWEEEFITAADFAARVGISAQPATLPAPAINTLNAAILGTVGNNAPSMTQGYGDGQRTEALKVRAGWCLGPWNMTEDQAIAACRAWNKHNTPPKDDAALVHDVKSYAAREAAKRTPQELVTFAAVAEQPALLPRPFIWGKCGEMLIQMKDENDLEVNHVVSPYPIYISAVTRRENANLFSYNFKVFHPHNGWHDFILDAGDCQSARAGELLARNGADVNMKYFRLYIHALSVLLKGQNMDAIQYEQFGWKDDYSTFLVGSALLKASGKNEFAYGDAALTPRMKLMDIPKNTSLDAWSASANKLYAPGFEAMGFSLLASFAAVLITFVCGNTDGGAILALFSKGSGRGKSKILEAIASVWGRYDALSISGKDTQNSKFGIISRACHLPVYEEELIERDPFVAADHIKAFTMGRDKNRAQRDGAVAVKSTRYQTIMISASNRSVYELVKQSGDEGAVARVFEIAIDLMEKEQSLHFREIADTMLANCGHAGRAFISALLQPGVLPWVRASLDTAVKHYINELETQPEHRFVVWIMATCRVAAPILNAAGILTFDERRVLGWGEAQAVLRVSDAVVLPPAEALSEFINQHANDCLTVSGPFHPKKIPQVIRFPARGGIVLRMERANQRMFIAAESLRRWMQQRQYDFLSIQQKLEADRIVLNPRRLTTLSAGTDLPPARVACWEIDTGHPDISSMLQECHIDQPADAQAQAR